MRLMRGRVLAVHRLEYRRSLRPAQRARDQVDRAPNEDPQRLESRDDEGLSALITDGVNANEPRSTAHEDNEVLEPVE